VNQCTDRHPLRRASSASATPPSATCPGALSQRLSGPHAGLCRLAADVEWRQFAALNIHGPKMSAHAVAAVLRRLVLDPASRYWICVQAHDVGVSMHETGG